jgi:hypothetical protein
MTKALERGQDSQGKTQVDKLISGLDALLKEGERLELIYSLDAIIGASSPSFHFKDVSHRTLSHYVENGDLSKSYFALQMPAGVQWDAAQEQNDWPNYGFGESEATQMFDDLFPADTQNSSSSQESGQAVIDAALNSGAETQDIDSGTPGFPKDGMRISGDKGTFVVSLSDFKNPSAGFNVHRQGGTSNIDEARKPLNSQPIKRFNNAFAAVRKAHGPGNLDSKFGNKNNYSLSRQERRSLLKNADKALKSRESAIKKGAFNRAKDQWVDDKLEFINNIPDNAKDLAGRGLKQLGTAASDFGRDAKAYAEVVAFPAMKEKAQEIGNNLLESMDALANYQNEFSTKIQKEWPKVRAQIERGVDFAKPHLQNIALDLANQAETLAQNGVAVYEAGKQWAKEKYPIVQGLIEQAKVKGTPAFNAAKGKLNTITSKVIIGAGRAYEAARSVKGAALGFMDRVKGEFNEGRRQQMEARHGKGPRGEFYEQNGAQAYWEERGNLATELAKGNDAWDKAMDKIGRSSFPEQATKDKNGQVTFATVKDKDGKDVPATSSNLRAIATNKAIADFVKVQESVEEGALKIGSSRSAVEEHVQKIKDPRNDTTLPPSAGWPPAYGGASKVNKLQRNLKVAGLQPYGNRVTPMPSGADLVPQTLDPEEQKALNAGQEEPSGGQEQSPEGETPAPNQTPPALGPGQDGEQPALSPGQEADAPALAAGEQQQAAIPGVGLPGGQQEEQALAGGQLAPQAPGGGGGVSNADKEYLKPGEQGPPGVKVQQGEARGEKGTSARYYLRSEAKQNRANAPENGAQAGAETPGGGGTPALNAAGGKVIDLPSDAYTVKQRSNEHANGGVELANNNEMVEGQPQQDDYAAIIERAVEAAKQDQAESKVRMAKAGARKAVAKAGEAEAKAEDAEKVAELNIADLLNKIDSNISVLTAHANPRVSRILSKLSNNIDTLEKKPTTKK